MINWLKKNIYSLLFFVISIFLFTVNYKPGTWLIGWDNLFPEFDFFLNIKRGFFAIWQQYRGLGLVDGMSHASLIIHDLTRLFLSLFLKTNLIRWVYILGLHLVGGLGMMRLLHSFLDNNNGTMKQSNHKIIAFLGALFYMFNLGSIIQFYLPLEVFIVHFAFLPWLVLTALNYINNPNKKNLIGFFIISLLSTPQAHVPTVFIAYAIAISIILTIFAFQAKFKNWKKILIIITIIFASNSFWFIPFAVTNISNSKVVANTKAFQMSSNDIFYRNNKYGDFADVALIKGYPLEFQHLNYKTNSNETMMWPWVKHLKTPFFYIPAWIFFFLAVFGLYHSIKTKNKNYLSFAVVFIFSFFMLGSDIPIINWLSQFLRNSIPLFNIIFRFTFTKFSIVYVFSYSVLLTIGISEIIKQVKVAKLFLVLCFMLLVSYSLPSFQGHFFYENLKVKIPDEYFQVFDFFKNQKKDERIAELPIPWYWAWLQPRWGTINSGFIWHGIEQPLLDLAFMPWGSENENYYWELDQAIYSKNPQLLKDVLKKYDISWIYFDKNNLSTPGGKITYSDYEEILSQTDGVELRTSFGLIKIYHFDNQNNLNNFVSIKTDSKNIGPSYSYDNFDFAYQENSDYYTDQGVFEIYYPFRTLFAGKSPTDQEYKISEDNKYIIFEGEKTIKINKEESLKYSSLLDKNFNTLINDACDKNDLTASLIKLNNGYRLVSVGSHNCIKINLSDFSLRNGYLLNIKTKNDDKRGFLINLFDNTTKKSNLETYLDNDVKEHNYYFVVSPRSYYGLGYTLYFDNLSEGREKIVNDLYEVNVYQIPYELLKSTKIYNNKLNSNNNPIYYLSQSYHPGWIAISNGKILPHVLVNNWANGWKITTDQELNIFIVFWPQYLEFLGFGLLVVAFLFIILI